MLHQKPCYLFLDGQEWDHLGILSVSWRGVVGVSAYWLFIEDRWVSKLYHMVPEEFQIPSIGACLPYFSRSSAYICLLWWAQYSCCTSSGKVCRVTPLVNFFPTSFSTENWLVGIIRECLSVLHVAGRKLERMVRSVDPLFTWTRATDPT